MKKLMIVASALLTFMTVSVAFASDNAAELFKTHCQGCHGSDGGRVPAKDVAPIRGQSTDALLKMLEGYKDGSFGGTRKQVMTNVVKRLSSEQMKSVADYASTL